MRSLDIFDEKAHPLTVWIMKKQNDFSISVVKWEFSSFCRKADLCLHS